MDLSPGQDVWNTNFKKGILNINRKERENLEEKENGRNSEDAK